MRYVNSKKVIIYFLTTLLILLIFSLISSATGAAVKNLGNSKVDCNDTISIENDNAPKFVKAPVQYSKSKKYAKTKGFETKKNVIKTKSGNKKYTFKTEYFLPMSWKNCNGYEYWYNCQSMVIKGKYMFVVSSSGYDLNKGFIVRYDMSIMKKYKLNSGKGLDDLRMLGAALRDNKKLSTKQKKILKSVKKGPIFNIGHGQSLAYNPKSKSLWMWRDDKYGSKTQKLMRISMKSLKPNLIYKFSLSKTGNKLVARHNLAFDKEGNFYFHANNDKSNSKGVLIFKGKIVKNKVQSTLLAIIKNRPGTFIQSLAINLVTNRLFLVSDGAFYSLPIIKLNEGTLKNNDLHYTVLKTKREFEGISFDKYGKAYLLVIRGTEILKSNSVYY